MLELSERHWPLNLQTQLGAPGETSDLVVEADIDEVSVLQAGGFQDGGKLAAQSVSPDNVVVGRMAPAADAQILIKM